MDDVIEVQFNYGFRIKYKMMRRLMQIIFISLLCAVRAYGQEHFHGFFNFSWDAREGRIWLEVSDRWEEEFLYVNSLSSGIGSNDIGLDRNQLGSNRIVKFVRSGPKLLLVEPNYRFRAESNNAKERLAVEEAFARSVIWGFKIEEKNGRSIIDLTPFLLRDAQHVARTLERTHQGSYKADESRSAINLSRTRNFPKNSEFDAIVTLVGDAQGDWVRSVTPNADAVTIHMHHAFIALPDDAYIPRKYDPRSGFIPMSYYDYAAPIDKPIEKKFIRRHRLNKKNPELPISDPVEPIIYYVDPGCPEPIKSALIEGAQWWNQAFEAAGYRNAFQVKELPEGADPMDVRYNMINWVHRATRGWSYGSSIVDPRTGEILKGHVLLGSLRVRQDYLIAQGLAGQFEEGKDNSEMLLSMALARLRQLSAHEVGHTIGLAHNFAASYNNRASVMDYPHPYITMDDAGNIDLSNAYDEGIGLWDKRMILYGYQDFPRHMKENEALEQIINESLEMGLKYLTDEDARSAGSAHPYAHLWDNGTDPIIELKRMTELRSYVLAKFGEQVIPEGTAMAYLEQVLVPLYFSHRYQIEAVSKLIGGIDYSYKLRGDNQAGPQAVDALTQQQASFALLNTLEPDFLELASRILDLIPPQPAGYERHRELFASYTGHTLDPMAIAESSVSHTLQLMLHPERLARIHQQHLYDPSQRSLTDYLYLMHQKVNSLSPDNPREHALVQMVGKQLVFQLLKLAGDKIIQPQVAASALLQLSDIESQLREQLDRPAPGDITAHRLYVLHLIEEFQSHPESFKLPENKSMPPGAPIGCEY